MSLQPSDACVRAPESLAAVLITGLSLVLLHFVLQLTCRRFELLVNLIGDLKGGRCF